MTTIHSNSKEKLTVHPYMSIQVYVLVAEVIDLPNTLEFDICYANILISRTIYLFEF